MSHGLLVAASSTLAVAAAALGLSACDRAPVPPSASTSHIVAPTSTSPAAPTTLASTTAPASASTSASGAAPRSTTAAPSTTIPSTTTAPSTPPTTSAASNACALSSLSVVVERGSGIAGHQYATLVFTNSSAATCTLSGYPSIALLDQGRTIGSSKAAGTSTASVTLAASATASAQLVNNSTCGADNSDSIRISVPGSSASVTRPLSFRGCTVTVGAFTAGS